MKVSNILLLTLFLVIGSIIFVIQNMRDVVDPSGLSAASPAISVPVPTIKPRPIASSLASLPQFRFDPLAPEDAGSFGRLSLDEFLAKGSPSIGIGHTASITPSDYGSPAPNVIYRPRKKSPEPTTRDVQRPLHIGNIEPMENLQLSRAEAVSLPYLPEIEAPLFIDRVVDLAEASPVQPDARDCGTLKHSNLKAAPKHAKVRSVGLERQLTGRASIGVEYVYKDGCYQNDIAAFKSLNMPGDDGVNLRVNMKF